MKTRCVVTFSFDLFDEDDSTPDIISQIEKEGVPVDLTMRGLSHHTLRASGRITRVVSHQVAEFGE